MSSLLTPDFGLLFWMVISFAVVFVLLARFGFPVITKSVAKRSGYITDSLAAADEANRKLAEVKQDAGRMIDQALAEQAEILRKAVSESEAIVRSAQERAVAETEKQLASARDRIELQKEKAMAEISSQVAAMAIDIAERVLRSQLDDPKKQHALVLKMVEEVEKGGKQDNKNKHN